MKIIKLLIRSAVLLIVAFMLSACIIDANRYICIDNITSVMSSNGFIYIINNTSDSFKYDILKVAEDKSVYGNISFNGGNISGKPDEQKNLCKDFLCDDKGNVYIHTIKKSAANGAIVSENIYLCDFNNKDLQLHFLLKMKTEKSDENKFGFKIFKDKLYYVENNDNKISLVCINNDNNLSGIRNYYVSDSDINFIDFKILDDMTVIAYSSDRGIFIFNEQSDKGEPIYGNGSNTNSIVNFGADNYGNVLFYDINSSRMVRRSPDGVIESIDLLYNEYTDEYSGRKISYDQFKKVNYISAYEFIAITDISENKGEDAVWIKSGSLNSFKKLEIRSEDIIIKTATFTAVIFLGLELVLLLIMHISCVFCIPLEKRRIKYIPVAVRVIMLTVFVTLMSGLFISFKLKRYIIGQLENEKYNFFLDISCQIQTHILPDDGNRVASELLRSIVKNKNFEIDGKLCTGEYHCLHVLDNGTLYTSVNEGSLENVPTSFVYPERIVKLYSSVKGYEKIIQHDSYGDWYVMIYRLSDNRILETGMEKYIVDHSVKSAVRQINLYTLFFFLSVLVFFSAVTTLYLFPVKKLSMDVKKADLLHGSKGLEYQKSNNILLGENEITRIAESLDFMYGSIQRRKYEIEKNNKTYDKFICNEIFSIIGKDSVTKMNLGDCKKFECLIMKFILTDITDQNNINEVLDLIICSIEKYNGSLEYFNSEYVYCFFQSEYKNAVDCAASVIHKIKEHFHLNIYAGMSSGEALAAVIGGNMRNEGIIISRHKDIADKLGLIAQKLGCSMLMTGFVYSLTRSSSENILKRFIGNMTVSGITSPVLVYEIIDSNCTNIMNKKIIKKFEAGMNFYYNMKPQAAKKVFAEVIGENNCDLVAKYYYDKCENKNSELII